MSKVDENYHKLLKEILEKGYEYEDPNRKGVIRKELASYQFRHEFKDGFPAITTKKLHYKNVVTELIWFLRGDTNIKYLVDNGCNIWNKDAYNYYKSLCLEENWLPHLEYKDWLDEVKKPVGVKHRNAGGDLGKVYGYYWRNYDGFDQIKDIIDKMINTPMSSEIIVTARNPNDKDNQALPCCHYGFQIIMRPLTINERFFSSSATNLLDVDTTKGDCHHKYCDKLGLPRYGFELHWDQRSVDSFLGKM